MKNLLDIKYWIFDLDNTLYSGQTKVFSEVDKKMSAFISKKMNVDLVKAREIQKKYFYEYGTTLSGLMKQDNIDPHDFLKFVHDIDISWLPKDLKLKEELIKIKEKKFIFTNGSHAHVDNITKQLGIDANAFDKDKYGVFYSPRANLESDFGSYGKGLSRGVYNVKTLEREGRAKSLLTHIGPIPGPPPPWGIAKVL